LENCDLLLVIEDGQLVDVTSEVSKTVQDALALGGLETVSPGAMDQG
jgi:hypothetical protein